MFIGHFGVGLAAKKFAPKASLGTLFLSAQLVDLLWPMFLLLGLEHVRIDLGNTVVTPLDFYDYPITHSLVGVLAWAVMLGLLGLLAYVDELHHPYQSPMPATAGATEIHAWGVQFGECPGVHKLGHQMMLWLGSPYHVALASP